MCLYVARYVKMLFFKFVYLLYNFLKKFWKKQTIIRILKLVIPDDTYVPANDGYKIEETKCLKLCPL